MCPTVADWRIASAIAAVTVPVAVPSSVIFVVIRGSVVDARWRNGCSACVQNAAEILSCMDVNSCLRSPSMFLASLMPRMNAVVAAAALESAAGNMIALFAALVSPAPKLMMPAVPPAAIPDSAPSAP